MSGRVAVVGSREYADLQAVREYVKGLPKGTVLLSGGARGVDTTAETHSKGRLEVWSYRPTRDSRGEYVIVRYRYPAGRWTPIIEHIHEGFTSFKDAALWRNRLLVALADRVRVFWDGASSGTGFTRKWAIEAGKLEVADG